MPPVTQTLELRATHLWQGPSKYLHLLLGSWSPSPRHALQKLHTEHVCPASAGTTGSHIYLRSYVTVSDEPHIAFHPRVVHAGLFTTSTTPTDSLLVCS